MGGDKLSTYDQLRVLQDARINGVIKAQGEFADTILMAAGIGELSTAVKSGVPLLKKLFKSTDNTASFSKVHPTGSNEVSRVESTVQGAGTTKAETVVSSSSKDTVGNIGTTQVESVVPKSAKGLIGKDFEDYLVKALGEKGSFKAGGREFDGAVGNRWYEAKSGRYWEDHAQLGGGFDKFKSDIGARRAIAKQNGATYEVHSNTPIPSHVQDWLNKKGIPFTEH